MTGKGYVKITVDQNPEKQQEVGAQVHLEHVNIIDKIMLLSVFAKAIELDEAELVAAALTVPEFRKSCNKETVQIDMSKLRDFDGGEDAEFDEEDGEEN